MLKEVGNEEPALIDQVDFQQDESAHGLQNSGLSSAQNPKEPVLKAIVLSQLAKALDELSNTLNARLYNSAGEVIYGKDIPIRELIPTIQQTNGIYGVVLNGIITQRLVELAQQKGIKALYGLRANPMPKKPADLIIYTKEQGRIE